MSIQYRNQTTGILERVAGFNDTDSILSPSSKNPISNKAVYNALLQKIDKTVTDLINYYDKSQVYTKSEVRTLIGSINTLTIEVVSELPTQDISTTTIYFVGPATGTNTYDEYVYVNNAWVKIGDTDIDLTDYVTSSQLTTILQDYYTKNAIDALLSNYYTKTNVDNLLDDKQDILTFDNAPTMGSNNPVTSGGIKTALDTKQNTLTFDSTPTEDSSNPVTSDGIKDAIEARKFSNPNLLDNPWFTVNQRGQSDYPSTTWTYWVDRWQTLSKSNSTVGRTILLDNGIKISADTISTTCDIVYERKMKDDFVFGKTYTLSFMLGDGTIYSKSGVITEPDGTYKINITLTEQGLNARIANETNQQVSCIITAVKDNTAMTLRAVKLELGEVSTLANDVVPDYETELAKCRTSTAVTNDTYANQGSYFLSADNAILGAKNLLPLTLSILKANTSGGTWTNNVYVKDGVTFTVSVDSSDFVTKINIDGTTSSNISNLIFNHNSRSKLFLEKGQYIISKGNTNASVQVYWNLYNNSTFIRQIASLTSTESKAVTIDYSDYNAYEIGIHIPANTTITNTDVYPMIRLATDTDSTYQPYAMTNRELTEKEQIQDISSNAVATIGTLSSATYIKKIGNVIYFKINISGLNLSANTWTDVVHITGESLFNGQLCTVCAGDAYMGIGSIENANDGILIKAKLTQAITNSFLLLWGTTVVQ